MQAEDEVLLETTGGFRNAVMDLLLLSRILSYTGVKTIGAVYSNYPKTEIEDLSHLIGFFDLVGGMQELTSFGSVKTLRAYYRRTEEPKIERLLSAMENLYETITLCKAKRIDACMQTFDAALTDAETCGDMMMRQLLPAFRKKFGKKLTTPGLIKWCIQSDMLQQAVTVYTERIPAFVIECGHFIEVTPFARTPEVKEYEDAAAVQFMRDFMTLSKKPGPKRHPLRELNDNSPMVYVDTIENMENMLISSGYRLRCPVSQMQQICRDYLYIKTARNMMNHANDSATQDQQELVDYAQEGGGDLSEAILAMDFPYPCGDNHSDKTPEGAWRFLWSHLPRYLKEYFYGTFQNGGAYSTEQTRRTTQQWLTAFRYYLRLLQEGKLQDPESAEIFPTRWKVTDPAARTVWERRTCAECGNAFDIMESERDYYREKGMFLPRRCPTCRRLRRKLGSMSFSGSMEL